MYNSWYQVYFSCMTMTTFTPAIPHAPDLQPWNNAWLKKRGNYMTRIDPDLAAELLKRNINNRRPKPRMIEQFKRDMQAGRWDPDASDLKFSEDGLLIDGQNRLLACVEAGVPFETLVRTGLNPRTRIFVDTGTRRTAADAIRMNNPRMAHYAGVAAAIALRSRYNERIEHFDRKRGWDYKSRTLTHDEVISYLEAHPHIERLAATTDSIRRQVVPTIPNSALLAAFSWFAEVDEKETETMISELLTGDFGGQGDPLQALLGYAARVYGFRSKIAGAGPRGRIAQEDHMIVLIRVWNARRRGEGLDRVVPTRRARLEVPE